MLLPLKRKKSIHHSHFNNSLYHSPYVSIKISCTSITPNPSEKFPTSNKPQRLSIYPFAYPPDEPQRSCSAIRKKTLFPQMAKVHPKTSRASSSPPPINTRLLPNFTPYRAARAPPENRSTSGYLAGTSTRRYRSLTRICMSEDCIKDSSPRAHTSEP